ncbi:hypothetical protein ACFOEQ_24470 [Chryseobacterium arachidis]|uniref:type IX secretion system sortase PorU, long form n=1 Tax=Chryseobacterium arachidis TaxID=1416778 RepID=UPI003607B589
MKQKISLLFLISFVSMFWSQRVSIEWDGSKIRDYGDTKLNLPNFKNEGFSFSQNNIFITTKQQVGENQLKVSNMVWENVSGKDLFSLSRDLIPENEVKDITYYNLEGGRYASINVSVFKKINGQVQRLSSFEISPGNGSNNIGNTLKVGTTNNPLSTGNFYKIRVDKSGIFKITKQFLQDNGINPSSVNPKNFRIYGNGGIMLPEHNQDVKYSALQENAIQVVGEDDGVWNDNDYALFYAQGPNGYNLYNTSNGNGFKRRETRTYATENVKNIYEDYSYYYINFDKGPGKRVQPVDVNLPTTPLITRFDNYQVINNDQKNLMKVGRTWVEDTPFITDKAVSFTTASPIQAGDAIRYKAQVIGYKSQKNKLTYDINTQNPVPFTVPEPDQGSTYEFHPMTYQGIITGLSGNQITFNLKPDITLNPNGTFYPDYFEVQYKDNLNFNGTQMSFRDFSLVSGSNTNYGFSMTNAASAEQIWDVTDITNANRRVNKAAGNTTFNFGYITSDQNLIMNLWLSGQMQHSVRNLWEESITRTFQHFKMLII